MVLVPYKQVVRDLKMDLHGCTKNLFPFVNRTLVQHGFHAVIYCVRDNWVQFNVAPLRSQTDTAITHLRGRRPIDRR
jgi:hypothetical protein